MNWLDIVLIVALLVAGFFGLRMGLWKIIFSVAGVIVGIIIAGRFASALGQRLTFISDATVAQIAGFAIIFAVIMIASAIAAGMLQKVLSAVLLGWINPLGGLALGVFLDVVSWGFLLEAASRLSFLGLQATIDQSVMARFMMRVFNFLAGLLPGGSWPL
ncbi:MAG: CvpA family protein [Dehalococcoidales bacterium]|nr:CvpA family protein [Dehalococcoidales bacterium]